MGKIAMLAAAAAAVVMVGCSGAGNCCCKARAKRAKVTVEPGRILLQTDFANGTVGWTFSNFQNILSTQVVSEAGCSYFRLANNHAKSEKKCRDTMFGLQSDFFPVEEGAEFAVVVEARGSVSLEACFTRGGLSTAVLWFGADKKPILVQDPLGKMVPSGWEFGFRSRGDSWLKTVKCGRVPAGAAFAKVKIGGDAPDIPLEGGNVEFKRIAVRMREGAQGPWDFGDLSAPTFHLACMTPDPNPNAAIRFAVKDESELDMSKFRCVIDGADVTRQLVREGDETFVFKPTAPWEKDSLHLIAVEAADDCGNAGSETLAFFCGERFQKGIVTLRDDNMVLIDGKPFFPIAPTSVRKAPPNGYDIGKAIADLKGAGFNTVHTYNMYNGGDKIRRDYHDLLKACDKAGVKLLAEIPDRDYKAKDRPARLREALIDSRKYGCVLGWGLGDDTASHRSAADVKADDNIVKAIDNARITWQADISTYAGRQIPFVGATDALITEIYPFRAVEPEPEGLAKVAQCMKYAYADKKDAGDIPWSVWGLPQAFSGWSLWKRFPTLAEIRAQSYISIINGARGLVYYSYYSFSKGANGFGHEPGQFKTMAAVATELSSIQDDLASRDAKDQPKVSILNGPEKDLCGNPSVTCLLKEGADGKGRLLIAANTRSDKAVKAKILVRGAVETLFENDRKVDAANGLVETFEPGAVHVYRLK